jgi:hypothetical protein
MSSHLTLNMNLSSRSAILLWYGFLLNINECEIGTHFSTLMLSEKSHHIVIGKQEVIPLSDCEMGIHCSKWMRDEISYLIMKMRRKLRPRSYEMGTHIPMWMYTASNGAFEVIAMWSVGCLFRSGWFANMISSFAFVVIKGWYDFSFNINVEEWVPISH